MPGLKVIAPSFPADYYSLLRAAIEDPNPVLFLEHKRTYRLIRQEVTGTNGERQIGRSRILRTGDDLTMYAYGLMLHQCLAAAEELAKEGPRRRSSTSSPWRRSTARPSSRRRAEPARC